MKTDECKKLLMRTIVKLRKAIPHDNQHAKLEWMFYEAFKLGLEKAKKIYRS